jgi:hypothetical protein
MEGVLVSFALWRYWDDYYMESRLISEAQKEHGFIAFGNWEQKHVGGLWQ